ncbi:MAG: 1-hydroxycarotenoid 3,4-desaturase CrtD [Pseudomonadales bacterium]
MSSCQAVIVGAGMGGLAAGIELAAAGFQVTLFEQSHTVGGKMREVQVHDAAIDSGPTVFTMRWLFEALFRNAGRSLDDYLTLERSAMLARHAWSDGSQLDLFADLDASLAAITDFAGPTEARAYQRFVAESGRMFDTLDQTFMQTQRPGPVQLTRNLGLRRLPDLLATRPFSSLHGYLQSRFSDPRLVQLFGRYATYCGSSPFSAPATLALIAEAERRGVWAVRGGMQRLAEALATLVGELGGRVICDTPVHQLRIEHGRCVGVELADGSFQAADAVVFNGDSQALADGMLGSAAVAATPSRGPKGFSLSAVTWSMIARARGVELAHHTVCFGDDYQDEFAAAFDRRSICARPTVYVCAGPPQAAHQPGTDQALFCLINAPACSLDNGAVEQAEAAMLEQLQRCGIQLSWQPDQVVRTTPTDFSERFPASRGALYGRPTHGAMGSFSRPGSASDIQGLYLAGASVHPGAGIPMATQSGRLAAQRAIAETSG